MNKSAWQAAAVLLLAAASVNAGAAQRKEVRDGQAVEAIISEREVTRIRVENAKIAGVVGKIQSASGCANAPEPTVPAAPAPPQPNQTAAEASITCDLSKGEIYLRALSTGKKPINLFVSTERATYTLVLRKDDRPSDTIVLFDPSLPKAEEIASGFRPKQAGHVKGIKAMLRAMLASRTPDDVVAEDVSVPLRLWQEASFTLTRTYRGRGFIGERYQLTNVGNLPMTVTEQEFDREADGVVAVAIESLNLRPGDATWVYVIRNEEQP